MFLNVCVCLNVYGSYEIRFPPHHSTFRWHAFTGMFLTLNMLIACNTFSNEARHRSWLQAPSCLKMHQIFNFTLHASRTRLTLNGRKNYDKGIKSNTMELTILFDRTEWLTTFTRIRQVLPFFSLTRLVNICLSTSKQTNHSTESQIKSNDVLFSIVMKHT